MKNWIYPAASQRSGRAGADPECGDDEPQKAATRKGDERQQDRPAGCEKEEDQFIGTEIAGSWM